MNEAPDGEATSGSCNGGVERSVPYPLSYGEHPCGLAQHLLRAGRRRIPT